MTFEAPRAHHPSTMPTEGNFLALKDGAWIEVERYQNPFDPEVDTVINRQSGQWWTPLFWMPLPIV